MSIDREMKRYILTNKYFPGKEDPGPPEREEESRLKETEI